MKNKLLNKEDIYLMTMIEKRKEMNNFENIKINGNTFDLKNVIDNTLRNTGFTVEQKWISKNNDSIDYLITHDDIICKNGYNHLLRLNFSYFRSDDTLLINTTDNISYKRCNIKLMNQINDEIKVGRFQFHMNDFLDSREYELFHEDVMNNISDNTDKLEIRLTDIISILKDYLTLLNRKSTQVFHKGLKYLRLFKQMEMIGQDTSIVTNIMINSPEFQKIQKKYDESLQSE